MAELFPKSLLPLFFFTLITVHNSYNKLEESQKISIMYITVYFLKRFNHLSLNKSIMLVWISLICFLEILTDDQKKLSLLVNPLYKIIDCVYLSIFQYGVMYCIASLCISSLISILLIQVNIILLKFVVFIIELLIMFIAVSKCLEQKYVIRSFTEMIKIFEQYPIYEIYFNEKFEDACKILVSVEDNAYFERNGYTMLSLDYILSKARMRIGGGSIVSQITRGASLGKRIVQDIINGRRGFSTIPMQLIRSLGIERGYDYVYRRKIYEIFYSRIFFDGLNNYFSKNFYDNRNKFKQYLLYVYFHSVNTFLVRRYEHFLDAFDSPDGEKKDIYTCSNEGILIACLGLSKQAMSLNNRNEDYFVSLIRGVPLDRAYILELKKQCEKGYRLH